MTKLDLLEFLAHSRAERLRAPREAAVDAPAAAGSGPSSAATGGSGLDAVVRRSSSRRRGVGGPAVAAVRWR